MVLRDTHQPEKTLIAQLDLLGNRNQEFAVVTGVMTAAGSISSRIPSLMVSLREIIADLNEWDNLNERRQDDVLPQDTDSLHEEKQALETVGALISIEDLIGGQETACQTQASALVVPKLQDLLSGLERPTVEFSTTRSSFETFARRLHLHRSLAAPLGKTAALKK